jgi:exosome complex component RRP4
MTSILHLVVPGQVIATSSSSLHHDNINGDDGFLRGHGTYVESVKDEERLVASVCGVVHRVNKLVTVIPFATSIYQGHVGDLVIGRITSVGTSRWQVSLVPQHRDAQLPLSGVHLPGGVQRMRTAQDQRDMRQFLQEGDLISAEVHKVQASDGALHLHTRSMRYSKLENGCLVTVPPSLIQRQKNQIITMIHNTLDVLWGTNGNIWIQRRLKTAQEGTMMDGASSSNNNHKDSNNNNNSDNKGVEQAEVEEQLRQEHARTPVEFEERMVIARLRNAIECLRLVHSMVTPDRAESIYKQSLEQGIRPADMLLPENIIRLSESCRK